VAGLGIEHRAAAEERPEREAGASAPLPEALGVEPVRGVPLDGVVAEREVAVRASRKTGAQAERVVAEDRAQPSGRGDLGAGLSQADARVDRKVPMNRVVDGRAEPAERTTDAELALDHERPPHERIVDGARHEGAGLGPRRLTGRRCLRRGRGRRARGGRGWHDERRGGGGWGWGWGCGAGRRRGHGNQDPARRRRCWCWCRRGRLRLCEGARYVDAQAAEAHGDAHGHAQVGADAASRGRRRRRAPSSGPLRSHVRSCITSTNSLSVRAQRD
jgi:hypothetical protein